MADEAARADATHAARLQVRLSMYIHTNNYNIYIYIIYKIFIYTYTPESIIAGVCVCVADEAARTDATHAARLQLRLSMYIYIQL